VKERPTRSSADPFRLGVAAGYAAYCATFRNQAADWFVDQIYKQAVMRLTIPDKSFIIKSDCPRERGGSDAWHP